MLSENFVQVWCDIRGCDVISLFCYIIVLLFFSIIQSHDLIFNGMLSFLSVITNTVYLEYSFYKAVLITLKKIFRKNWVLSCWVALIEEDCYFHFQRINWLLDIANIPMATAIGLTTCQVYWVNWKVWHIGQLSTVNTSCWFLQIQIFFGIVKKLPELLGSAIRRNISSSKSKPFLL